MAIKRCLFIPTLSLTDFIMTRKIPNPKVSKIQKQYCLLLVFILLTPNNYTSQFSAWATNCHATHDGQEADGNPTCTTEGNVQLDCFVHRNRFVLLSDWVSVFLCCLLYLMVLILIITIKLLNVKLQIS